jgi:methionyl-tRNA formyltransferase
LQPDLCVTVAYGNFLPKQFLAIPVFGTLNIHPSLLPKYRGAAPVQRCLEAGEVVTGVSVAETVLKMDAGPIGRFTCDRCVTGAVASKFCFVQC